LIHMSPRALQVKRLEGQQIRLDAEADG